MDLQSYMTSGRTPVSIDEKKEMISFLLQEAHAHPALNHPWLNAMASGSHPNPSLAFRVFAKEYYEYAHAFPYYLLTAISRMDDAEHKKALRQNLEEEKGRLGDAEAELLRNSGVNVKKIVGASHSELYRRFCLASFISEFELQKPAHTAMLWRDRLLEYLNVCPGASAIGAIGLGTESIVKATYGKLLKGLREINTYHRDDYVFFELHCIVGEKRALDLETVAIDLLKDKKAFSDLRAGMLKALALRHELWDYLYEACNTHGHKNSTIETLV